MGLPFLKRLIASKTLFFIMNAKVAKHLSIPENRINYSFHFLDEFGPDFVDYKKCYDAIAKWSDKLDTSEAHF